MCVHIYIYMHMYTEGEVAQSCPTLCDPMVCSLLGFSVHGIFHARVLEWVTISFSRGSSRPRDWTQVSRIVGRRFYHLSHQERYCYILYEICRPWIYIVLVTFLDKRYLYIKWGLLCNAEDVDSIPGWEINIPQVLWCDQKKKKIFIYKVIHYHNPYHIIWTFFKVSRTELQWMESANLLWA